MAALSPFSSYSKASIIVLIICSLLMMFMGRSSAKLTTDYYKKTCPKVFSAVESVVKDAIQKEKRMGASLLRLHFHDCFVQGCDGSVLLDDTSSFTGEKTAAPNNNSVRGFNVVDDIKSKVEYVCPGVVSCADILAIAARDSVALLGGPKWDVKLGRRDSKTASFSTANSGVIPPPTSNLGNLINRFQARGLSTKDMVVLSGAHTIGQARCTFYRNRIYNETNIHASLARKRQRNCPRISGSGDNNLAPLDVKTPTFFDNSYYKNLIKKKGLLHSDQILYNGSSTDSLIKLYSKNPKAFNDDFVTAIIKMGDISPLTGSNGEIRKNCRRIN
ncbi:Peroxidase [Handroanthus impetiginosus]|uniref:Peroxidase n=1 Tax=Handroanthus impetiginosus TaxID=429701 RepID=A0A2G9G9V6_9LAMI|nr:Peroxidase [Handroanthus impetiginosus]